MSRKSFSEIDEDFIQMFADCVEIIRLGTIEPTAAQKVSACFERLSDHLDELRVVTAEIKEKLLPSDRRRIHLLMTAEKALGKARPIRFLSSLRVDANHEAAGILADIVTEMSKGQLSRITLEEKLIEFMTNRSSANLIDDELIEYVWSDKAKDVSVGAAKNAIWRANGKLTERSEPWRLRFDAGTIVRDPLPRQSHETP